MARFTIAGNYLYVVDKTHLKVFNVSEASLPVLKSNIEVGFEIETIYPFRDKLFIGSTSVVHIFSIEVLMLPFIADSFVHERFCETTNRMQRYKIYFFMAGVFISCRLLYQQFLISNLLPHLSMDRDKRNNLLRADVFALLTEMHV